jgi:hypothetical protein
MFRTGAPADAGKLTFALGWAAVATILAGAVALAQDAAPPAPGMTPHDGRIGLVLTQRYIAVYQTPGGKDECPDGFQHTNAQNYLKQFPTEAERFAWEAKYSYPTNRGPHGENVFYNPLAATDALPFSEIHGRTAIGLNLDGKVGPNDFTSPEGEPGIDNQLYRVVGCMAGLRNKGVIGDVANRQLHSSQFNRIMIEISGVDNLQNDDNVEVTTYRGLDPLVEDVTLKVVPGTTQRIDTRYGQRFIHHLKGKIVDGVLITEPADVVLPSEQNAATFTEQTIRDMRLRIKLTSQGGEGLMGGYLNVEDWWFEFARTWGAGQIGDITGWSPVSTYRALRRYADAYPDKAGANQAISVAYTMKFTPVFIVHPQGSDAQRVANR